MSRDHRKLTVFQLADQLVLEAYRITRGFPDDERFGLQSQIRRGAVSIAANLVEGCARPTTRDYLHFCSIALGSACEVRYLLNLAFRLGFVQPKCDALLQAQFDDLVRGLQGLTNALSNAPDRKSATNRPSDQPPRTSHPKPEPRSL